MIVSGYEHPIIAEGKHYLYRYIRHDKNEPFYIGIGTKHEDDKNGGHARAVVKKYNNRIWMSITKRTNYDVEILLESDDYTFVKQKEQEFIKLYGRIDKGTGSLANLTDGGEGTRGMRKITYTDELRKRMSESHMGKRLSPESQAKRIATLKEKYRIDPPIISESQKKRLRTERLSYIKKEREKFANGDYSSKRIQKTAVINTQTKEVFMTVGNAADSIGIKRTGLYAKLSGQNPNNTVFMYLREYNNLNIK